MNRIKSFQELFKKTRDEEPSRNKSQRRQKVDVLRRKKTEFVGVALRRDLVVFCFESLLFQFSEDNVQEHHHRDDVEKPSDVFAEQGLQGHPEHPHGAKNKKNFEGLRGTSTESQETKEIWDCVDDFWKQNRCQKEEMGGGSPEYACEGHRLRKSVDCEADDDRVHLFWPTVQLFEGKNQKKSNQKGEYKQPWGNEIRVFEKFWKKEIHEEPEEPSERNT